jgi:NYN domain
MPPTQRTIVYVDGFNLYYGALKGTPYRWLDLGKLCQQMLRGHQQIMGIKYFTARVQPRPGNPQQAQRQQIYLRALATVPNLSIYYGRFITRPRSCMLEKPPRRGSPYRSVWITEEKGSDVNLSSHLLIDGFRARYDLAVVISNDSDLKTPIEVVRQELNAPVGVLNPHKKRSWALSPPTIPAGSFYIPIRRGVVASCQFPPTLTDPKGKFSKPATW